MSNHQSISQSIPEKYLVYAEFARYIGFLLDKTTHSTAEFKQLEKFPAHYLSHYIDNYGNELSEEELRKLNKIIRKYSSYKSSRYVIKLPECETGLSLTPLTDYITECLITTVSVTLEVDLKKLLNRIQKLIDRYQLTRISPVFQSKVKSKILSLAFHTPKGNKNPPVSFSINLKLIRKMFFRLENNFEEERFNKSFSSRRLALR